MMGLWTVFNGILSVFECDPVADESSATVPSNRNKLRHPVSRLSGADRAGCISREPFKPD